MSFILVKKKIHSYVKTSKPLSFCTNKCYGNMVYHKTLKKKNILKKINDDF